METEKTYTVADVIAATGLAASTIQNWLALGRFPATRGHKKQWLIEAAVFEQICEFAQTRLGNFAPITPAKRPISEAGEKRRKIALIRAIHKRVQEKHQLDGGSK